MIALIFQTRIPPSEFSDSSETRESERESAASDVNARFRKCTIKPTEMLTSVVDGTQFCCIKYILIYFLFYFSGDLSVCGKSVKDKLADVPKHNLLLFVTTLLLIFLFLSAAVLLYRIVKVQNKYTMALQVIFRFYLLLDCSTCFCFRE